MQVLLLIGTDLFPRREAVREGPALNDETDAMKEGNAGVPRLQRVGGRESGLPSGEEGGVSSVVTGGGESAVTSGEGERLHPGENKGWEEES